ncbi:MAG TPA: hypothetical protein O0X39_04225 [Methanocorpusculum sp.]|nr:hypothetical protein [Methanocorpusculum sp.]
MPVIYQDVTSEIEKTMPALHASRHAAGAADAITPAAIGAATSGHTHVPADIGAAAVVHTHGGSDIISGVLSSDVLPIASGAALGVVKVGSGLGITADGTISAYGEGAAHADTHAIGGIDAISPADIGAASTSHAASHADGGSDEISIDASQITAGTIASARLPAATWNTAGVITALRSAQNLYVSTTGSDTTGDGTSANPFATVNKALSLVSPFASEYATVYVAAGTYTEDVLCRFKQFVNLNFQGDVTINGTMQFVNCNAVSITSSNTSPLHVLTISNSSNVGYIFVNNCRAIEFSHLELHLYSAVNNSGVGIQSIVNSVVNLYDNVVLKGSRLREILQVTRGSKVSVKTSIEGNGNCGIGVKAAGGALILYTGAVNCTTEYSRSDSSLIVKSGAVQT